MFFALTDAVISFSHLLQAFSYSLKTFNLVITHNKIIKSTKIVAKINVKTKNIKVLHIQILVSNSNVRKVMEKGALMKHEEP